MARDDDSFVTLRGDTYYENFTVNGIRFRGSLKTHSWETARIIAAKKYSDALLGKLVEKKKEMTLDVALGTFFIEVGQSRKTSADVELTSIVLRNGLGKETLLSELTMKVLANYAARRRMGEITHIEGGRRKGVKLG
jgi:hypothetical protein